MSQGRRLATERPTPGAMALLLVTVGASLLYGIAPEATQVEIAKWIIATDYGVWHELHLWKLATTSLIPVRENGVLDFVSLIFDGLMLWMFLPALEKWWGKARFLRFAAWTLLTGNLVGTLVGLVLPGVYVVSGIDPFIFGGVIAYGVLYSDQKVHFFGVVPLTGKQMAIGMSGFVAVFIIAGQRWADGASMASAMLLAYGLTSGTFAPKLWYLKWKQRRLRRKLKLVPDDKEPKRWMN